MHSLIRRLRRLALAGPMALAACADAGPAAPPGTEPDPELIRETRDFATPTLSAKANSAPILSTLCGPEATYRLWVGGNTFPGTIRVGNDRTTLYVTYLAGGTEEDGWFVSDARIAVVKSVQQIPLDSRGRIDPWSFPHAATMAPPTRSYTYAIPLASVGAQAGDRVIVAAWAGMVHPRTRDWQGPWEWLTGWGLGHVSGTSLHDLSNYAVAQCPNAPPPPPRAQGAISITFDDGWEETYTRAFPILRELGLRANAAVWPVAIDDDYGGFMSIGQVRELHAAGWSIVSHSMTHPYLTTVTETDLDYQLRESQAWIRDNGFGDGRFFVVPFHDWGERELAAIKRLYRGARGTSAIQFNPPVLQKMPIQDPYALTSYEPEFAPYTTAEGRAITREYLDRAVAEGAYIDILFHHIPAETLDAFRETMRIVAQYRPYIRTYDELIP